VRAIEIIASSGLDPPATTITGLEAKLEAAWPDQLGFTSTTIVRTRDEIEAVIAANPFGDREDTKASSFQVTFLKHEPEPLLELPFTSERGDYEVLAIRDRAIYSVIDETGKTPDVMRLLERTFGKAITTRSWKSVHRIATAMASP